MQGPDTIVFRGSLGKLETLGKRDIIRTVGGAWRFSDPATRDAMFNILRVSRNVHPNIKRVLLEGPWRTVTTNISANPHLYFEDALKEAQRRVSEQFPDLQVETTYDREQTDAIDWSRKPTYRVACVTCMDQRLDAWLSSKRDIFGSDLLVLRLPGGTSLVERQELGFDQLLATQVRELNAYNDEPLRKIELRHHRRCAAVGGGGSNDQEEVAIHEPILNRVADWLRRVMGDTGAGTPIIGGICPFMGENLDLVRA